VAGEVERNDLPTRLLEQIDPARLSPVLFK
jgi:hypothetical protein